MWVHPVFPLLDLALGHPPDMGGHRALVPSVRRRTTCDDVAADCDSQGGQGFELELDLSASRITIAVALLALQACNCGETLDLVPGDVRGRVCHPDSGDGLAGAGLVLAGPSDRQSVADANGDYVFERVLPGQYTLTATLDDVVRTFDVKVVSREAAIVEDAACRGDPGLGEVGDLAGQICNRHTGDLVTDGEVVLQLGNGELMLAQTDDTGSFLLRGIPVGEHVVTITGVGFQRAFLVQIVEGQTFQLDLAGDCDPVSATEGGIVGSFCDPSTPDGNLVGAQVTVEPVGGGEVVHELTDMNGQFEVNGLAPGLYRVDVTSGSFAFTEPQIEVTAGTLARVTDPSTCGQRPEYGRIEGQICDEDAGGRFAGNVELLAGDTVVDDTVSDSDGRFAFNAIDPGTYTVRAFYPPADPRGSYERVFTGVVVEPFRTSFLQEFNCPEPQDTCTEIINNPQQTADGRILLVVDRSGSMDQADQQGVRKWDAMSAALKNVTQSLTSSVEFGLVLYPERGSSDVCDDGSQILGLALNNATQIGNELDATTPQGGTPTAASLEVARTILAGVAGDGRPLAVLLATDGGPNCNLSLNDPNCRCTDVANQGNCTNFNCLDDGNTIGAVGRIRDLGVSTYVVGVTGVENFADVLNRMADVGGTALPQSSPTDPKYYRADNQAGLQAALEAITQRVLTCRVQTDVDLATTTSVSVRVGSQVLGRDTARRNGWDITGPSSIELFGSACDVASTSVDPVIVQTCVSP